MRKGWEYKKLGEVATFINGDRGKNYPSAKDFVESGVPFINAGHLNNGIISYDKMNYITINKYNSLGSGKIIKNDILFCLRGSLGKYAIVAEDSMGAIASSLVIIRPFQNADNRFIAYFLSSAKIKEYIAKNNNGSSQPNLSAKSVASFIIPLPPLSSQLAIVSELDKINELIRLKKEQLKDFDNLAQSLFYEMFGDPVENEKGWEVKKLGEVCEVTSAKRVFIDEVVESGVPFIRGTELTALSKLVPGEKMDYTLFITYEHYERLKAITGVPKIGDLLIPSINADGIVWMVDTEDPLYFKDGRVLWVHVNHEYYNSIAIQKLMNVLIKNVFTSMGGATFAELKLFVLRNMNVPTPPLSVQDAFSEKIKQIDAQKLQVKKSIQDLETLLASRMQYWFE